MRVEEDGKKVQYVEAARRPALVVDEETDREFKRPGDDWALVYFVIRTAEVDWPYWLPDEE